MAAVIDQPAPDFSLPATGDRHIALADLRGRNVVVYFYPRDNTPGCTQEGQAFRDLYDAFRQSNTEILGISRDSVRKHENFSAKHGFSFPLLADTEEQTCRAYGVLKEKNMYGRTHVGIERSTFLIDTDGVLRREWRGVKVPGHADEVLEAVRAL